MKGKEGREGRGEGNEHLCSTDPRGLKEEMHIQQKVQPSSLTHMSPFYQNPSERREREGGGDTYQRPTQRVPQPAEVEPKVVRHACRRAPVDVL